MQTIPPTRVSVALLAAASTLLMLAVPAMVPGCGPSDLEVDRAARYTPESLASELAIRFRGLDPDARTSRRKSDLISDKAAAERRKHGNKAQTKGGGVKKEARGPMTIDDVLDDIKDKLNLIRDVSRTEACRKMTDAISRDDSLTPDEKNTLGGLVGRLADER